MNLLKFNSQIVDITPSFPTKLFRMKGSKRHKDVYSNLESNLIHLISEDFEMFVFSIDLLFITSELYAFIKSELQKYFDLNDENILTIASHTHFSPSIERDREGMGDFDEKYFEFLKVRLAAQILGITRAQNSFVELEVVEMKSEKLTTNRRRKVRTLRNYCHEFIAMEPNLKGYKNETFKIIRFNDYKSKKTVSVLWSFPCHPSNFYDSSRITSEYPGAIRDFIRSVMEKVDISVVFIPGFMGDVRAAPPRRSRISRWIRNLVQLSYPVNQYKFISKNEYESWVSEVVLNFELTWKKQDSITLSGSKLKSKIIHRPLTDLGISVKNIENLSLRIVQIGECFKIYTISAEVTSEYIRFFDKFVDENEFYIASGYSDMVYGYLPTNSQIKEGGYECEGHFNSFLISGKYKNDTQNTIEKWIMEMK